MSDKLERMWIDQPSTHQPLHAMHGVDVLVNTEGLNEFGSVRAYPTSGSVISLVVDITALSKGWRDRQEDKTDLLEDEAPQPNSELYEMELHSTIVVKEWHCMRVSGGWIYTKYRLDCSQMNSAFVPEPRSS